ncbi:hypothetical protein CONPUDRAFT_135742 [Coniophora puteana RWD-64-598 SS2]|uniref:BZIP domain-containing protein n=1 Tax=Coniophora puteana (strain RWD-64-598) TaxID=741705 RepID=A0A5M3MZZ5_CONPW|nr:uncharacterized protein CONPUDRAFT_135742 [Coniophora puteana RWD-64-598 SS2]EIW84225.1 hypothetical protein CONPUDRAFT_135742 [Coniophora puteana RWD-64-598 SS2]
MSSKRGRKRNDNLPPNRARDVQRAFRARRAAHLQALELRVSELEEENNCLRAALNLPPASRPALGRGPTGKDKPKSLEPTPVSQSTSSKSRASSLAADSPSPQRSVSASPSLIAPSLRTSPIVEGGTWQSDFGVSEQHPQRSHIPSPPTNFNLRPSNPILPNKTNVPQYGFPNSMAAPPARNIMTSSAMHPSQMQSYSHTGDRPVPPTYNDMGYFMNDVQDAQTHTQPPSQPQAPPPPQPQPQYHYHYSSFPPEPAQSLNSPHTSQASAPVHPEEQRPIHQPQRTQAHPQATPLPYQQRRSLTEPQGFRPFGSDLHLPNPVLHPHGIRLASPPPPVHDPRSQYSGQGRHITALP